MPVNFEYMRVRRAELTLSLRECAERAEKVRPRGKKGWTAQQWSDLEQGRRPDPQVSSIEAAAVVLKCNVDDLISIDGAETAQKIR